jgi:ABC-type spermidine/putrescine transport system permease subunit II
VALTITIAHIGHGVCFLVIQRAYKTLIVPLRKPPRFRGTTPKIFLAIVLPLILPSLMAGWLWLSRFL